MLRRVPVVCVVVAALVLAGWCGCVEAETVRLLSSEQQGTSLAVDEAGIALLRDIGSDPVAVVAITGPSRSGKSFFMNNLLGSAHLVDRDVTAGAGAGASVPDSGFVIGSGVDPVTKGVWLHPNIARVPQEDGSTLHVLFMDTEGFGGLGNVDAFDPKLCFLTSVFASTMLYNVYATITQDNVRFLHTVASINEVFKVQYEVDLPSAPISWVVQNFGLEEASAESYLDKVFIAKDTTDPSLTPAAKDQLERYNAVVHYVRNRFPDAPPPHIWTLPYPREGVPRSKLPAVARDDYDPEYVSTLESIRSTIRGRARPKFIGGNKLTGNLMADLITRLATRLNSMDKVGHDLVLSLSGMLAEECFNGFQSNVSAISLPAPHEELVASIDDAGTAATGRFDSECIGGPHIPENEVHRDGLTNRITAASDKHVSRNIGALQSTCHSLRKAHDSKMHTMASGLRSLHDFDTQVEALHKEYLAKCEASQCIDEDCMLRALMSDYDAMKARQRDALIKRLSDEAVPTLQAFLIILLIGLKCLKELMRCCRAPGQGIVVSALSIVSTLFFVMVAVSLPVVRELLPTLICEGSGLCNAADLRRGAADAANSALTGLVEVEAGLRFLLTDGVGALAAGGDVLGGFLNSTMGGLDDASDSGEIVITKAHMKVVKRVAMLICVLVLLMYCCCSKRHYRSR